MICRAGYFVVWALSPGQGREEDFFLGDGQAGDSGHGEGDLRSREDVGRRPDGQGQGVKRLGCLEDEEGQGHGGGHEQLGEHLTYVWIKVGREVILGTEIGLENLSHINVTLSCPVEKSWAEFFNF